MYFCITCLFCKIAFKKNAEIVKIYDEILGCQNYIIIQLVQLNAKLFHISELYCHQALYFYASLRHTEERPSFHISELYCHRALLSLS